MFESRMFLELLILLGSVTAVATLCHYLRLPTIIGFIFAGVAVGPSGLALVSSLPNADSVAEIAVIFLMFTIGLEFSFKRLWDLRRDFLKLGLTQVVITVILIALVTQIVLGFPLSKSIFLGLMISLSSTALVMKLLQDSRDLETPYGKSAFSILLSQDLAVIPMMLALPLLAGEGGNLPELKFIPLFRTLIEVAGVLFALWASARYVIPVLLERVVKTRSREVFFFSVLFFCLGIAYLFHLGGVSLSLGAFAAGLMIAEGPYGRQVTSDILPLRDNFLGVFFASVGMLLDLKFLGGHFLQVVMIGTSIFALKGFVLFLVGLVNRSSLGIAAIVALMLSQVGEFSFILASRGLELKILTADDHQYFLCVSVLSMIFTPFLFKLAPKIALARPSTRWKVDKAAAAPIKTTVKASKATAGHTIIVGFGISGQNMATAMQSLKIPFKAVELNYEVVKKLKKRGVDIHFGDATRAEVLAHAGIDTAKLVVVAVSGAKIIGPIVQAVRNARPDVQIIVRSQYVRDVESLKREPLTDIVIAEIETAIELLARSLKVYGVGSEDIRQYMEQARTQLSTFSQLSTSLASPTLTLPSWEALSSIRPMRIGDKHHAVGKSLADLNLPRLTGTSVVSVFRDGLGTTIPGGSFVFQAGDVTHLIGSPESLAQAEQLLKGGV